MQRIVDGILFEGQIQPDVWEVSTWQANGVRERSVRQAVDWREIGPVPELDEPDEETLEERRAEARKRSAKRSKTECRRFIISQGFDEMLTITTRENIQDRKRFKRHFKEWVRRMRRALGGHYAYCASFEKQERGAFHAHVACHKLPKHATHKGIKVPGWRLGTTIWRDIVGQDNGLVFVGGKTKAGTPRAHMSLAEMAAYVSKYILKDWEDVPKGENRYSHSEGADTSDVVRPEKMRLRGDLADIIAVTFELMPGEKVMSHRLNRWHDGLWLVTERRPCRDRRRKRYDA